MDELPRRTPPPIGANLFSERGRRILTCACNDTEAGPVDEDWECAAVVPAPGLAGVGAGHRSAGGTTAQRALGSDAATAPATALEVTPGPAPCGATTAELHLAKAAAGAIVGREDLVTKLDLERAMTRVQTQIADVKADLKLLKFAYGPLILGLPGEDRVLPLTHRRAERRSSLRRLARRGRNLDRRLAGCRGCGVLVAQTTITAPGRCETEGRGAYWN